jgi:hypothetical protein
MSAAGRPLVLVADSVQFLAAVCSCGYFAAKDSSSVRLLVKERVVTWALGFR